MDGKAIEEAINNLNKLIFDLGGLDEGDYPVELVRLLTGLGHMTNVDSFNALSCLLPAFTYPLLQKTVDIALSHILCKVSSLKLDTVI